MNDYYETFDCTDMPEEFIKELIAAFNAMKLDKSEIKSLELDDTDPYEVYGIYRHRIGRPEVVFYDFENYSPYRYKIKVINLEDESLFEEVCNYIAEALDDYE